ncbi:MAG: RecX family transcriptional regulator [Rhodospirillales bacterium]|nr:MAG: RecX family transcriptional regulator [Rhodospirillales bacterium]
MTGRRHSRKAPRKITPQSLENAAAAYLQRFAASAETLRRVLLRRVRRSAAAHGTDPEAATAMVAALIERYRRVGLIDDRAFAEGRAARLHRRGLPISRIRRHLAEKGVAAPDIDGALAALAEADTGPSLSADARAAFNLARRRRLGPFRPAADRALHRDRDLAALARAGFAYALARRLIDAETPDAFVAETAI